jgi:hypothetical protein
VLAKRTRKSANRPQDHQDRDQDRQKRSIIEIKICMHGHCGCMKWTTGRPGPPISLNCDTIIVWGRIYWSEGGYMHVAGTQWRSEGWAAAPGAGSN